MNKQTIQQVEDRRAKLMMRLVRTVNELAEIDRKLKKMRTGKIKVPPPTPKVVKWEAPAFDDRVDDLHPVAPGSSGPC